MTTESRSFSPAAIPGIPVVPIGGFSGAYAAAVASGMVVVAACQRQWQIHRISASERALVGLKPTRGEVSRPVDWRGLGRRRHDGTLTVRNAAIAPPPELG